MQATVRVNRNRTHAARSMPLKRARFWLVCLLFLVWALVIAGRLFWLQVVRHAEFVERAQKQQERTIEVAPRRGVLYDRNLRELAMTVQVDSLYAIPADIDDKPAVAHQLSALVHIDPEDTQTTEEQIAARLASGHNSIRVARDVSADAVRQVTDPGLKGIFVQKEFERFYPDNEIAAQVLGYVGVDDNGLGGLEQKFEQQLHGVPGHVNKAMDARRHVMGSSESDPEPGQNLVLTIDENIQFLAERALDHAMQRTQAENGTAVVQDVHTGQILALAIRPTFNPNNSRHTTPELLRNHAVSDVYEPGSAFKLVTYAAALEQHVTAPDDTIDCQGGKITLAGRVIHDDKGEHYGRIPVHEALEHSSDVAAVKLALKVGQNRFYDYVRGFGFGSRSGVELPGETRGLLRPVNKWEASSIGSVAIGQEIGVTPLQLVSMVSTIANGGVYLPPHVLMPGQFDHPPLAALKAAPFKPGGELPNPLPAGAHRVISTLTAAQMRKMMEGVVLYGTGRGAQLNGYSSGGKTGTAQKIDPATHLYSKTMHIASFVGIAPVNNPVIAIAVVLDSPKGAYYGAQVSAPVFAEVAQQVLEYLGVTHDIDVHAGRAGSKANLQLAEDDVTDHPGDINALYSAANELPSDDPLRASATQPAPQAVSGGPKQGSIPVANPGTAQPPAREQQAPAGTEVVVSGARLLRVPSLIGLPVRKLIEQAALAGFEVEITGNGTAREQMPVAGTMAEPGTRIAVRCGR
jgi:cell division protein FtsI (penicillin-binding protein 3)